MSVMTLRTSASRSTQAEVVISPAMIATPVLTRVSQATRARLSCIRIASNTASEIWSATLSGCPSETDSDVKRYSLTGLALIDLFIRISGYCRTNHKPPASRRAYNFRLPRIPAETAMALTPSTMPPLGMQAPDFSLPDTVSGENLPLQQLRSDKATVV